MPLAPEDTVQLRASILDRAQNGSRGLCCVPREWAAADVLSPLLAELAENRHPVLVLTTPAEMDSIRGLDLEWAPTRCHTGWELDAAAAYGLLTVVSTIDAARAVCFRRGDSPFGLILVLGELAPEDVDALLVVRTRWTRAAWIAICTGHPAEIPAHVMHAFADFEDSAGLLACVQIGPAVHAYERVLLVPPGPDADVMPMAVGGSLDDILEVCKPGEHVLVLVRGEVGAIGEYVQSPVYAAGGGTDDTVIWELNALRESKEPTLVIQRGVPAYAGIHWRALVLVHAAPNWGLEAAIGQLLASGNHAARVDVVGIGFDPVPLVAPILAARARK